MKSVQTFLDWLLNALRFTFKDSSIDDVMIALLVPPSFLSCLAFENECLDLDFGMTIRNVLQELDDDEYGCALGLYECSLEMELTLG